MRIDLGSVDHVLTTTRAVRLRLDLDRDVDDADILRCIDIAEQAPCGGSQPSRRWVIARDPALRRQIAAWYREILVPAICWEFGLELPAPGEPVIPPAGHTPAAEGPSDRVFRSALHLAEHLGEVPAIVLATIYGEHDRLGHPGLFDSVIQAAWSFCLAARARGLGTCWTTAHLERSADVARLLGVPDGVTQIVLLPVAHTTGGEFHAVTRAPAEAITYFDHWGFTRGERPGVTLEADIAAPAELVHQLIDGTTEPAAFTLRTLIGGGTRVTYTRSAGPDAAGTGITATLHQLRQHMAADLDDLKRRATPG